MAIARIRPASQTFSLKDRRRVMQRMIDLDRLLKLRLVVARFGEMDAAKWWNTKGQLGRLGATALRRGFPRTHHFAQARSVFAVAAHRCTEVFDPPGCVTLWRLPEAIEEEFDARWEHWLDRAIDWQPFFQSLEVPQTDLIEMLRIATLVEQNATPRHSRLRRSAEGLALSLYPGRSPRPMTTLRCLRLASLAAMWVRWRYLI